ncbi:MAG: ATP synthase F1 subunit gamma [Candidatus Levybacteria bacterium]|nr:ATP synthase F1 subunit gamma [Candidatus Levybacteria bacterium]
MANISLIKRRIQTAQNVSKTTRAMQMIATSKLKRAQDSAVASKPYVEKLTFLTRNITDRIDPENISDYMKQVDINVRLLVVVSPDKGLCGGLITNLLKELLRYDNSFNNVKYIVIGKKAEKTVAKLGKEIVGSFDFGTTLPIFENVYPIVKLINDQFLGKNVSGVDVLYTNFFSVFSQKPNLSSLLPIKLPDDQTSGKDVKDTLDKIKRNSPYTLFEPSPDELLPSLLSHYLEMAMFQYLLESYASEQGARMISMKNATENAYEIIDYLKLEYNKKRQEKITNEILDIGGGAMALAYE